jgi:hypothetical protein
VRAIDTVFGTPHMDAAAINSQSSLARSPWR